jgi:acetyltransferase-like isoleucine patch superfamily enzyme
MSVGRRWRSFLGMSMSQRARRLSVTVRWLRTRIVFAPFARTCGAGSVMATPTMVTPEFISLGSGCHIGPRARIEGIHEYAGQAYEPHIVIGDAVSIEQNVTITAASLLSIGRDTTISFDVMITDIDHGHEAIGVHIMRQPIRVRRTAIGENCFIGAGAKLLAGTVLGRQCIVGANAVVRGRFDDYSVIVGIPGRVVSAYRPAAGRWDRVSQ